MIYTYKCKKCEHQFENKEDMEDLRLYDRGVVCPKCGGKLQQNYSKAAIIFTNKVYPNWMAMDSPDYKKPRF